MAQLGGGSIIYIASIAGKVPDMTEMAYGTSKAAICHITKMVASQAAPVVRDGAPTHIYYGD